jgi:integrase
MKHTRQRYQQGSLTIEARKTGPSVWAYRWREKTDTGTIKRKVILGTIKELSKTQAQRKSDLHRVTRPQSSEGANILSVADLVDHYTKYELCESSGKALKVRKAYLSIFRIYLLPKWGKHSLGSVKPVEVEVWLKSLAKANGTKAKIREVFGAAFRHGMRHELFPTNPISNVRQVRRRTIEPSILEPEETASILRQLNNVEPVRTAFLMAAVTGIRRGELFGLKWEDVDLQNSILHIRRSFVDGVEGPPKTESSRRPLPIPQQAVEALTIWKARSAFAGTSDWVFASDYSLGRQPLWPGTLWQRNIKPAIDRAKISKPKLGWHSLRRSFASLLLSTGASLRVSMELMRHSTAEMTLATYAQSVGDYKRVAGGKVADLVMGEQKAA